MARTPALEYRWFKTNLENSTEEGEPNEEQKSKLADFEKLEIAGVKLNTIKDLGLAYAPIPFINWLGLYDQTVSGDKLEQANKRNADGTQGDKLDNIVRSRLSSVDNIEVVFGKGIEITSGKIAASKVKAGEKLTTEKYETKQFSIGFPGELTAVKEDGKPLFPVIERSSKQTSTTRSKTDNIASKFGKDFFTSGGQLLPETQVLDAEILEEEQLFFQPSGRTLYLPPAEIAIASHSDKLFQDII